jgi:hypothetical protein
MTALEALRAHAAAAKDHAEALTKAEQADRNLAIGWGTRRDAFNAKVRVVDTAVELADAYRAYTNPFNVSKTVDARWPNV